MRPPNEIFVLIDVDNSNGTKNYCWWFPTKKAALDHKKWQRGLKHAARIEGPFRFLRNASAEA